jgi:type II secretion system protein D
MNTKPRPTWSLLLALTLLAIAPTTFAQTVTNAAAASTERNIRFQFDGMPYAEVLERFAQMADKPLVADVKPEGSLTYNDPKPYSFGEAIDTFNVILAMKGFVLTEDDHYLRLIPLRDLSSVKLKILQGTGDAQSVRPEEIVTVVLGLKNLDARDISLSITNMLSKAGSVAPLSRGRGLILTDRLANIRRIESLINTVDTEAVVERQMRTLPIIHASGQVLQDLINRTFGIATAPVRTVYDPRTKKLQEVKPDPADYVTSVYDDASRTMVLFGPRERIIMAEELIAKFETKDGGAGDVRIYRPVKLKPDDLAEMIRQSLPGIAANGESATTASTKARLIVDPGENRLIVAAPMAQMADEIENLINQLDRPVHGKNAGATETRQVLVTHIYRVEKSDPEKVAEIISKAMPDRRLQNGDVKVTADPTTATVVITASPLDHQTAREIVDQMESGRTPMPALETRFVEVGAKTEAERLLPLVQQVYEGQIEGSDDAKMPKAKILIEPDSGRLIITATTEHLARIEKIVEQLRTQTPPQKREMTMLPVKVKTPDEMISLVTDLMSDSATDARLAPKLYPDPSGRQVIVLALRTDLDRIRELIARLDVAPVARTERAFRAIELNGREAESFLPLVTQLYQEQLKGATEPEGGPATLLAEEKTNRLMVSGSEAEIAKVENIIRQLDPEGMKTLPDETRVVRLESARAANISSLIDESINDGRQRLKVLIDERSNSLVLTGNTNAIGEAMDLVEQLDSRGRRMEPREMKVFDLEQADPTEISTMVSTLAAEMLRDQHGEEYEAQTKVVADTVGRRLILSGPRDEIVIFGSIVERLDKSPGTASNSQIFLLRNSEAAHIAKIIERAMTTYDYRGRVIPRLTVSADEQSNSVVVSGPRADIKDAEAIIQRLDGEAAITGGGMPGRQTRELRVINVNTDDASSLATLATQVFTSQNAGNRVTEQVTFTGENANRRILVLAPPSAIEQAGKVIEALDGAPTDGSRELQSITVANGRADEILKTVQQLYTEQSAGAAGKPATLHAGPNGGSLMVFGSAPQFAAIEKIVATLDTQPAPARVTKVINVGSPAEAQRLAPLVGQLYADHWKDKTEEADAKILADERAGRLIVTGREEHVKQIEAIVAELGVTAGPIISGRRESRVFELTGDATVVAKNVEQLYQDNAKARFGTAKPDVLFLPDSAARRLIVAADTNELAVIELLVKQLDSGATEEGPARIFQLEYADPDRVGEILSTSVVTYDYRGRLASKLAVAVDAGARTIIATGIRSDLEAAAAIVASLDTPEAAARGRIPRATKVFELKSAEADELVGTIQSVYEKQREATGGNPVSEALIIADEAANRIVVTGVSNELAAIEAIIQQLDIVTVRDAYMKAFSLTNAAPREVVAMLSKMFVGYTSRGYPYPRVTATPAPVGRAVLVSGSPRDLERVASIVTEFDSSTSGREERVTRFIPVTGADAENVAEKLISLYGEQAKGGGGNGNALILGDDLGKRVIITAASSEIAKLEELTKQLQEGWIDAGKRVQMITLKHVSAEPVAQMITQMFDRRYSRKLPPELVATASPDDRSVLIDGNGDLFPRIEELIKVLDQPRGDGDAVFRTVHLKKSEADNIAEALNAAISERANDKLRSVGIVPVTGSKSLLLNGPTEAVEEVLKIVTELDEESSGGEVEVRIYNLKTTSARDIEPILQQLLAAASGQAVSSRSRSRSSRSSGAGAIINIHEASNSLYITARPEQFKLVEELLPTLDQAPERSDKDIKYVWLQRADAYEVVDKIEAFYADRSRSERPYLEADFSGNSITVIAKRSDMTQIQNLISQFDEGSTESELQIRMLSLARIPANEMIEMLVNLYPQMHQGRIRVVDRLDPSMTNAPVVRTNAALTNAVAATTNQVGAVSTNATVSSTNRVASGPTNVIAEVIIAVDEKSNALLLSGPGTELDNIDSIVTELEWFALPGDSELHVYPLKEADPTEIAKTLNDLFQHEAAAFRAQTKSKSTGSSSRNRPQPPKMVVVPDKRSRSLIVRASPTDYLFVETLIKRLDEVGEEADTTWRFIEVSHAPATKVAELVTLLSRQYKYASQPGDQLVIEAHPRTGSVLLVGRKASIEKVLPFIADVDVPATGTEINIEQVVLDHADATAVAQLVTSVFTQRSQLQRAADGEAPERGDAVALLEQIFITSDPRLNTVHLAGTKAAIDLARRIIADVDREMDRFATDVKLISLRHALPSKIAPLLQAVFRETAASPATEGLRSMVSRLQMTNEAGEVLSDPIARTRATLTVQADDTQNLLIVAARNDLLPLIETVILKLDVPGSAGLNTVRVYPLEHIDGNNFRRILEDVNSGNNSLREGDRPTITVDIRSNSLIVAGNETAFSVVESLMALLDKELPLELRDIKIIRLNHAAATVLSGTIQQLMDARVTRLNNTGKARGTSQSVTILAESRSNSLLVTGGQDAFELVKSLAEQLDEAPPAISGTIRLVTLKYADARTVAATLSGVFSQRYAKASSDEQRKKQPIIIADARINGLLVSAAQDDNEILDGLIAKLDQKLDNPLLQITILSLQHNDAAKVSTLLENFFAARLRARSTTGSTASPSEQVSIETDSLNNTLIISSNTENLDLIRGILAKIDVEPTASGGVFEMFTLEHADAQRVATLIESLVKQGVYRPGRRGASAGAAEALAISVDNRSNTLIVSASPANLGIVRTVIERVDTADFEVGSEIKFYELDHAQASNIARALTSFFDAKRKGDAAALNSAERTIPLVIIPDDRMNVLMVTGSKESFEILDRIVPQLDGEDQMARLNYRVFDLENATAAKLQDTLQRLFANRPSTVVGKAAEPITLIADPWVNALLVTAALEDMTMVESLIERLDAKQTDLGIAVEVIPVLKANATRVADTITGLYKAGTQSGLPIVVNADERMNAIVVSGGKVELDRIREVVAKLDTDQVSRVTEIRIFPLENARAEDLATTLTSALTTRSTGSDQLSPRSQSVLQFITRTEDGGELITSALKEAVQIIPNPRMNSLIVTGPVDYMGLIDSIIQRLDRGSPRQAQIRVFNLQNADANDLARVLTELFRLQNTGNERTIEYTLMNPKDPARKAASAVLGSEEASALRITVNRRTNSLLVGGSERYVSMVEEIINSFDTNNAEERKTEVVRLKNAQAVDIATAIRDFLDQDRERVTQVLGADAVQTAQRLLDREVSVVSEEVSNTLLISANSRFFESIRTIITELDKPNPQVLIQVLLTEVSVDAVRDLGVEWNYTKNIGGGINLGSQGNNALAAMMANPAIGGYSALVTGNNFNFLLRALENDGRLEVLSRPQILTADNQPAMVNIGQRIPLITDSQTTPQGAQINQFRYENVGVNLTVTPRITGDGFVRIDVATTNSSLSSTQVQINQNATVPIIDERLATTTVSVQSGKTVVIGGLISSTSDSRNKKVPVLARIPVLGKLFSSSAVKDEKRELLIFLTPQILAHDNNEIQNAMNPADFTKDQLDASPLSEELKFDDMKKQLLKPLLQDTNRPSSYQL